MLNRGLFHTIVRGCILLLIAAPALAAPSFSPWGPAARLNLAPFRPDVYPLRPEAAEQLKAEGRSSPELRFPTSNNRGRPFNPPNADPIGALEMPAELKALVLLVAFSDTEPAYDKTIFEDLILGTFYDPPGNEATLADGTVIHGPTDRTLPNYYDEVSFGALDISGTVVDWVKVDHEYAYYSNGTDPYWNGFGPFPRNVQGLVRDAVLKADATVDFSEFDAVDPYDRDEDGDYFEPDGFVDNLFVVHTGSGAEWTGQADVIWSHTWSIDWAVEVMVDGVQIGDYSMEPEYGGFPIAPNGVVADPFPPTVGVYAHEFGHVLGLPDEYDYGYESVGVGRWSGMALGSWNRHPSPVRFAGNSPAHFSGWGKVRLGFVDPIVVEPGVWTEATLPAIQTAPVMYRIDVPYSGGAEFFLLENRQQIGFDEALWRLGESGVNAHGLLVYHVDNTVLNRNYWRPNEAENWQKYRWLPWQPAWTGERHYGISLIQADDHWDLEKSINGGDGGDPFPGLFGITELNDNTFPNTTSYYFWPGSSPPFGFTHICILGISEDATGVVTATLYVPAEE